MTDRPETGGESARRGESASSGESESGGESALIIEVPEAESLVGRWRLAHDPSAALGIPAHVTVLYPFVPPARIGPDTYAALREICTAFAPFAAELRFVASFAGGVVYLAPEPADRFRALTTAAWERFPGHPPYEGRFEDVVPHLTIGESPPDQGRDLQREAHGTLAGRLPLPFRVDHVSLFVASDGRWSSTAQFALCGHE